MFKLENRFVYICKQPSSLILLAIISLILLSIINLILLFNNKAVEFRPLSKLYSFFCFR